MNITSCKVLLLLSAVLFFSTSIHAQKSYPQIPYSWHITQTVNPYNEAVSVSHTRLHNKGNRIYINDNTVVFPVVEGENEYIIKMDENGKILWKSGVAQTPNGLAKSADNNYLFAFYFSSVAGKGDYTGDVIKEISACVYELNTGKKVLEKVIYKNDVDRFIDVKFNTTTSGVFSNILIRQAEYKGSLAGAIVRGVTMGSESVKLISLNDKLEVSPAVSLASACVGNLFLGCSGNSNSDVFITSYDYKGNVTCEQFNIKGSLLKKLSSTISVKGDDAPGFALAADPADNNSIFNVLQYKRSDKTYVDAVINFNFTKSKVNTSQEFEHTKEVGEKLENEYETATGKKCSPIKHYMEETKVVAIAVSNNTVVSIKEIKYSVQSYLTIGTLLVSVYDKNLENSSSLAISKDYTSFGFEYYSTAGIFLENKNLYTVATSGITTKISPDYAFVDLTTNKFTKLFRGEDADHVNRKYVDGENTFWFKDHCLVQLIDLKNGATIKPSEDGITLQRIDY